MLTGDLKMDPGKIAQRHQIPALDDPHLEAGDPDARAPGHGRGARAVPRRTAWKPRSRWNPCSTTPATNSALPTLRIDAGPRIEVRTIGAKVSQRKLRRYVPVFEEHAVDHDLLVEGARNLRDYFQSEGYFDAEVEFKEQRVVNDQATIDYLVNTGERHKLVDIEIRGNRYFDTETIRERMFLRTASFLQFPHGRYSESLLRRDEDSIVNLYQSNGFRDVKVTAPAGGQLPRQGRRDGGLLEIEEGPQYFVNSLQVDGIEHWTRPPSCAMLSSIAGPAVQRIQRGGGPRHHPGAVLRQRLPQRHLRMELQAGRRSPTAWTCASPSTKATSSSCGRCSSTRARSRPRAPAWSTATCNLNPGDPLSPTAITETQRRLYDLGVFSRVDAAIQDPDGETSRKYVLYELEEARRYSLAAGLGRGVGAHRRLQHLPGRARRRRPAFRRASRSTSRADNLWGVAHSISLRTRFSTLEQRALLNYSWPRFRSQDSLNVSFTGLYEDSQGHPHVLLQARGRLGAVVAAALQSHHAVLPLHLPARQRGPGDAEDHAVPDPAAFAAGARGHDLRRT